MECTGDPCFDLSTMFLSRIYAKNMKQLCGLTDEKQESMTSE